MKNSYFFHFQRDTIDILKQIEDDDSKSSMNRSSRRMLELINETMIRTNNMRQKGAYHLMEDVFSEYYPFRVIIKQIEKKLDDERHPNSVEDDSESETSDEVSTVYN